MEREQRDDPARSRRKHQAGKRQKHGPHRRNYCRRDGGEPRPNSTKIQRRLLASRTRCLSLTNILNNRSTNQMFGFPKRRLSDDVLLSRLEQSPVGQKILADEAAARMAKQDEVKADVQKATAEHEREIGK